MGGGTGRDSNGTLILFYNKVIIVCQIVNTSRGNRFCHQKQRFACYTSNEQDLG